MNIFKTLLTYIILSTSLTLYAEKQNVRIDATTGVTNQNINFTGTVQLNGTPAGDMTKAIYDPANIIEQVIGTTATQTLTNKTLTSPTITTPTGITKTDVGLGNVSNLQDNLTAIVNPVGTDDNTLGYTVGSTWINTLTSKVYTCTDATTGLAVWTQGGTTSPLTTKGDIYIFDTVNNRLPVGTDGQILTADSVQAIGIKWATPVHLDPNAIHTNTSAEISTLTEKLTPANTDFLVIEDSASANAKKKIQIGNLPGVSSSVASVFGRTGAVVSTLNDYTWGQIDKTISSIADITTKSHTLLTDIGVNTHAQIDTHIADGTVHYTQASISIPSTQISDFTLAVTNHADVSANTTNRHASSLLGTKTLDETAIADAKVIGYNATSGNLEYIASGTGSINDVAWTGGNWTSTTIGESELQLQNTLKDVGVDYANRASVLVNTDNNKVVEAYYNAVGAFQFNNATIDSYSANLEASWKGEDLTDNINGHNWTNSGLTFTAGKSGNAFTGNGTSSSASQAIGTLLPAISLAMSVWFRTNQAGNEIILSSTLDNIDIIKHTGDKLRIVIKQSNGTVIDTIFDTSVLTNNTWYNAVFICEGGEIALWLNGVKETTTATFNNTFSTGTTTLYMGMANNNSAWWNGQIDEFYWWKDLSFVNAQAKQDFATALYNAGAGRFLSQTVVQKYQLSTTRRGIYNLALTSGTTIATDCANYERVQATLTLATNATLSLPTNMVTGGNYKWIITQDATGGRTLAYDAVFKFSGGVAPVITATANKTSIIQGIYDGTNIICTSSLNY